MKSEKTIIDTLLEQLKELHETNILFTIAEALFEKKLQTMRIQMHDNISEKEIQQLQKNAEVLFQEYKNNLIAIEKYIKETNQ